MRLRYLTSAKLDFERFRDFLSANNVPEEKVKSIIVGITSSLRTLEDNPLLGFSVGGKYGFETPYRGYICDDYIAIYEVTAEQIEIIRMYSLREDYVRDLLDCAK
jgi:plasmid stabilization system protein ParE